MSKHELGAVFGRFYRGAGKQHAGGTGLGLYLAHELVRAHRGTITAHSEGPGKGAEFRVRLPIARSAS